MALFNVLFPLRALIKALLPVKSIMQGPTFNERHGEGPDSRERVLCNALLSMRGLVKDLFQVTILFKVLL